MITSTIIIYTRLTTKNNIILLKYKYFIVKSSVFCEYVKQYLFILKSANY